MHYSVHPPSAFISSHLSDLLPGWLRPVGSVLLVLQPCGSELHDRTLLTEWHKRQLRQTFLKWSYPIAHQLQQLGHLAEVFDPKTGWPLLSKAGRLPLDDVAVARSCLGYPTVNRQGCSLILHPAWGSSVYPSTLLSSAAPQAVVGVAQGLRLSPDQARSREYHHSRSGPVSVSE